MDAFGEFEHHLHGALSGLYDPAHRPPEVVWSVLSVDPGGDVEALWEALVTAIGDLEPSPALPAAARVRRVYDLLSYRYVQSLTQEAAAERLGISPRHLRREQRDAVHVLAQRLWSRSALAQRGRAPQAPQSAALDISSDGYLSQVRQELESLRHRALDSSTDVGAVISSVAELGRDMASRHGVTIEPGEVQPALMAAIHPSALRQVLITAVSILTERMSSGQIRIGAERVERCARVVLEGRPVAADGLPDISFINEIMSWSGGSSSGELAGDRLLFWLMLPVADPVTVLVVDDNEDMVHFFRRYAAGTRYAIASASDARGLHSLVEQTTPDIIVLDVMLPEVDGWDVLMQLRGQPKTKTIPVIVCSVVRERELALSLGATVYLPKPVRRQEFIQALDQALARVGADSGKYPESIPEPC